MATKTPATENATTRPVLRRWMLAYTALLCLRYVWVVSQARSELVFALWFAVIGAVMFAGNLKYSLNRTHVRREIMWKVAFMLIMANIVLEGVANLHVNQARPDVGYMSIVAWMVWSVIFIPTLRAHFRLAFKSSPRANVVRATSAISLAAAVMIVSIVFGFLPHLVYPHIWRYETPRSKYPIAYLKPTKRALSQVADAEIASNQSFEYGKLVFQTAWPKARKIRKNINRFGAMDIRFADSKRLLIMGIGKSFAKLVLEEPGWDDAQFVDWIWGDSEVRTNYSVHKQIIEHSLDDHVEDAQGVARMRILNITKAISYVAGPTEDLYSFDTGTIKGWQQGKPHKKRPVILSFYDRQDRQYEIMCFRMTQQEIDVILATMSEL